MLCLQMSDFSYKKPNRKDSSYKNKENKVPLYPLCTTYRCHKWSAQGRTAGGKGGTMSEEPNHWGRRKVPTMSQVLSPIQYIYSQKTLASNTGALNLFLDPGAI